MPNQTRSQQEVSAAYELVARKTKQASTNFYYAFKTLPEEKRNAVYAGYAFCRLADDIVDDEEYAQTAELDLANLRSKLERAYAGDVEGEMWIALSDAVQKYPIKKQHLLDVVDGCEMDLRGAQYDTFDDLLVYCHRVASATGLALIEVFGYSDDTAVEYALDLGVALQLTNILRDVREDYERGRVYIPREDLIRFNVSTEDLALESPTPEFKQLMRFQVERARKYLLSGSRVIQYLDRRSALCPSAMMRVYKGLLDQIEKSDFDVLGKRPSLSKLEKIRLLASIWVRNQVLRVTS